MDFRKFVKSAAIAVLGLTISATSALAFSAKSTTALNVRSGPGANYDIVDALYKGEKVNVKKCNRAKSWCYVSHTGLDGWVSAKYLGRIGGGSANHNSSNPQISFGLQYGSGSTTLSFGFSTHGNTGHGHGYTPKPRQKSKICFYSRPNFKGREVCVKPGAKDKFVSGYWNDRASSIKIIGDAAVKVCTNRNFKGKCRTFDRSVRRLGARLNNNITSFRSFRY